MRLVPSDQTRARMRVKDKTCVSTIWIRLMTVVLSGCAIGAISWAAVQHRNLDNDSRHANFYFWALAPVRSISDGYDGLSLTSFRTAGPVDLLVLHQCSLCPHRSATTSSCNWPRCRLHCIWLNTDLWDLDTLQDQCFNLSGQLHRCRLYGVTAEALYR